MTLKIESNDELKEIDIKNHRYYHFGDIIKIEDLDFDNILINYKSYENILVYGISYKTLIWAKPLPIMFDKVDGFIRDFDRTRYLVLCGREKHDVIFNRIIYLINQKSFISYVISHNYAKIKVALYDSLPLEKILTFNNFIIFINFVFNKEKNNYYYNIFLEKYSDK